MGVMETRFKGSVLWGRNSLPCALLGLSGHIAEVLDDFFSLDLVPLVTFIYPPLPPPNTHTCVVFELFRCLSVS